MIRRCRCAYKLVDILHVVVYLKSLKWFYVQIKHIRIHKTEICLPVHRAMCRTVLGMHCKEPSATSFRMVSCSPSILDPILKRNKGRTEEWSRWAMEIS